MPFPYDLIDDKLDEIITGQIEIATALLGLILLASYGIGFVERPEVLQLALLMLAASVGLDQYVMRRIRKRASEESKE